MGIQYNFDNTTGNGELTKKLSVVATKFSATAAEKIAKAGGSVEQV